MPRKAVPKKELTLAAVEALVRRFGVAKGRRLDIRPTLFLGFGPPVTTPNWAKVLAKDLRAAWDRSGRTVRAKKG